MAVSERERKALLLAGVRRRVVVNSLLKAAKKIKSERSDSESTQKGVPVALAEGEGLADRPGQGSDETRRKHKRTPGGSKTAVNIQLTSSQETDSDEKISGPSLAKQKQKEKVVQSTERTTEPKPKKSFVPEITEESAEAFFRNEGLWAKGRREQWLEFADKASARSHRLSTISDFREARLQSNKIILYRERSSRPWMSWYKYKDILCYDSGRDEMVFWRGQG